MYPEFIIGGGVYTINYSIPVIGILVFIGLLYYMVKVSDFRFRDIISKVPWIVVMSLLMGSYINFIFHSGNLFPHSLSQVWSIFSISVDSLDFIGLLLGCSISTIYVINHMPSNNRYRWWYIFMMTYLLLLIVLGIFYTLGDSVVGRFNDGFFSVGSFMASSRINQLGGSVYPIGLLISMWSLICVGCIQYFRHSYPKKIPYLACAGFLLGYIVILHYQHYPRHLMVQLGGFYMDMRSYFCIAIACIVLYLGYSDTSVYRFSKIIHEDSVGKTR